MPWIRIDDHYDEHPKLAKIGPLGQALWLAGLAYCNRNLTDGFIPWSVGRTLVSWDFQDGIGIGRIYIGSVDTVSEEGAVTPEYVIEVLLAAGVWTEAPGGYEIHDYNDFQPTKAQVIAERATKAAAGQAGGLAAAKARAKAKRVADRQARAAAKSKQNGSPTPYPYPYPSPEGLQGVDGENSAREAERPVDPVTT